MVEKVREVTAERTKLMVEETDRRVGDLPERVSVRTQMVDMRTRLDNEMEESTVLKKEEVWLMEE